MTCDKRGKCTAYQLEHRISTRSIACCSAPSKGKNREKACAGCYLPVCIRLTRMGTDRKIWWSQAEGIVCAKALPFMLTDVQGPKVSIMQIETRRSAVATGQAAGNRNIPITSPVSGSC